MFKFSPKEDKFYTLFVNNAEIAHEAAIMLNEYVGNISEKQELLIGLKETKKRGDLKVREIIEELNKTFLTPFDREDIYAIAKEMDNLIHYIERSASRFDMFNVVTLRTGTKELSEMIVKITYEQVKMMKSFSKMNKDGLAIATVQEINKIEDDGDTVSRSAIKVLFSENVEAIDVIKWRELYKLLENTLDACQHVANLVEGVVMKNA
ncbi:MAG: DUF47 domain-containing protein [Clostridiaceae bacterium]|nr:DUF47 domain-containing protein [Clostridiaceae bacterium]